MWIRKLKQIFSRPKAEPRANQELAEDVIIKEVALAFTPKKMWVKLKNGLQVFSTRDPQSLIMDFLTYGAEVTVSNQDGDWFEIKYFGKTGWVQGGYLANVNPLNTTDNIIQRAKSAVIQKNTDNEISDDLLPNFKIGFSNLAHDKNTEKVRKIINREFGLDFDKDSLQCTEYTQFRVLTKLNIKIDWTGRIGSRDGVAWPEMFTKLKRYKVIDSPKKGCAMSFAAGCPVPPGHVAFVEEINSETLSIRITEANWPPVGKKPQGHYNDRWLTQHEWQNIFKARFIDFT